MSIQNTKNSLSRRRKAIRRTICLEQLQERQLMAADIALAALPLGFAANEPAIAAEESILETRGSTGIHAGDVDDWMANNQLFAVGNDQPANPLGGFQPQNAPQGNLPKEDTSQQSASKQLSKLSADETIKLYQSGREGQNALENIERRKQDVDDARSELENAKQKLQADPEYKQLQQKITDTKSALDQNATDIAKVQAELQQLQNDAENPEPHRQVVQLADGRFQVREVIVNDQGEPIGFKFHPPVDPLKALRDLEAERGQIEMELQRLETDLETMTERALKKARKAVEIAETRYERAVDHARRLLERIEKRESEAEQRRAAKAEREASTDQDPPPNVHQDDLEVDTKVVGSKDEVLDLLKAIEKERRSSGGKLSDAEKLFLNQLRNDTATGQTKMLGEFVTIVTGLANTEVSGADDKIIEKGKELVETLTTPKPATVKDVRTFKTGKGDDVVAESRVTVTIDGDKFRVEVEMTVDASKLNTRNFESGDFPKSGTYRFVYEGTVTR